MGAGAASPLARYRGRGTRPLCDDDDTRIESIGDGAMNRAVGRRRLLEFLLHGWRVVGR